MRDAIRIAPGATVRLADLSTSGAVSKADAQTDLEILRPVLHELHRNLWAQRQRALLVVLQGMDTSGKDSVIRQVFSGLLPQALEVHAFGVPSAEEASHDFLWRYHERVPPRGKIGIANRSWYESILVERVDRLVPPRVWRGRMNLINSFEAMLADEGIDLLKIFLRVSKAEQARRLKARHEPGKMWKHDPHDERKHEQYKSYRSAYEDALSHCSTKVAPWYVVPADAKPARNLAVAQLLATALKEATAKK